jgi:transposase
LVGHAEQREIAYLWTDPGQLARALPGLKEVGGPVLISVLGRAGRFPNGAHFKAYVGLTHERQRPGTPTAKANRCPSRLDDAALHPDPRRRPLP